MRRYDLMAAPPSCPRPHDRSHNRRLVRDRNRAENRGAPRRRAGLAGGLSAFGARSLEGQAEGPRRGGHARKIECRPARRPGADPLRSHAQVAVRVFARRGVDHGLRPVRDADIGHPHANRRRLPPDEFRRIRHARTQYHLRHQRLRRNAARTVGMGYQAPVRQHRAFAEADNQNAVLAAAHSYRDKMAEFAAMSPLQCWYSRIDADQLAQLSSTALVSRRLAAEVMRARSQTGEALLAKTTELVDGQRRIKDTPPLLFHPQHWPGFEKQMRTVFQRYRLTVPDDRRHLLDRYKLVDVALKVVGVGSVGTRCAVALLMNGERAPLFLQFKEARESVLAPYVGKSAYNFQGRRVVEGQRLMQSASDLFLGWARQPDSGTDYYVRQLRDMKNAIDIDAVVLPELMDYARFCGWALARAHAKAGDAGAISAYLGKSDVIGHALVKFAVSYADQSEADHAVMAKAVKSGRLKAIAS